MFLARCSWSEQAAAPLWKAHQLTTLDRVTDRPQLAIARQRLGRHRHPNAIAARPARSTCRRNRTSVQVGTLVRVPPVRIADLFPHDDPVAQWAFMLSIVADDLSRFQEPIRTDLAGDEVNDDIRAMIALHRQLVVRLYEAERLILCIDQHPDLVAFLGDNPFVERLRKVYIGDDEKPSAIRHLYGSLRHKTVHYPWVGSAELTEAIEALGGAQAIVEALPGPELHATWATFTAARWTLGLEVGDDLAQTFRERQHVLSHTVVNWGMLWGVVLPLYAARRDVKIEDLVDLSTLPRDQWPPIA